MQTLQTARLTTRPPPITVPTTSHSSVAQRVHEIPIRVPAKAPGILRHRHVTTVAEGPAKDESDPKTVDLISKFCLSQGLPFTFAEEPALHDFIRYINPHIIMPNADTLTKNVDRMAANPKQLVNFQKTVGPLSATVDVADAEDGKYLVFSIHYFEDFNERKNRVYIRKYTLNDLNADGILNAIRCAIHKNFANVRLTNVVCPNIDVFNLLDGSPAIKRILSCFYFFMSMFVTDLLEIEQFESGLVQLREFIRFIKAQSDFFGKFRRMTLSKNMEPDLPCIDDGPWCNTFTFLTKCLVLHDTMCEFVERHRPAQRYISSETFNYLVYLQRLLQQCVKCCRELSTPTSTISQIVPAIMGLHNFISSNSMGYRFQQQVRESLLSSFSEITNGNMRDRYNLATFLDARYAYRETIYANPRWKSFEEELAQEFVDLDPMLEKSFSIDVASMDEDARREALRQELIHYRTVSFVERPEEDSNPMQWWGAHEEKLVIMATMAREYLACPAVTVDAGCFFSHSGKFENVSALYERKKLEPFLLMCGQYQEFRGRGACDVTITTEMMETLNNTANRLQKAVHFGLYTHQMSVTEEERKAIIAQDFPPIPTTGDPDEETKPELDAVNTDYGRCAKFPHRMLQAYKQAYQVNGKPVQPVPIRQVPLQTKPGLPLPATKFVPIAPRPVAPPTQQQAPQQASQVAPKIAPQAAPQVASQAAPQVASQAAPQVAPQPEEEKKPTDLNLHEKEIKEEIVEPDMEKVKDEPLDDFDEQKPQLPEVPEKPVVAPKKIIYIKKTHASQPSMPYLLPVHVRPLPGGKIIRAPGSTPMPQNIKPHNFVQKFAGQQKFIPKFPIKKPLPPPISIRAPIPPPRPIIQEERKPADNGMMMGSLSNMREEVKLEPLDDFDLDDDFDKLLEAPGVVYSQALNEATAAQAFERHRANLEQHKRRACNRRCAVCGHLEVHERLKNVTIDNEKLLIMLGCIYRQEFTLGQAQSFMARETKTYICRVHFGETLDEIYRMLHLSPGGDVHACTPEVIQNALITITALRPHMTAPQLRKIFHDFVERNRYLRSNTMDLLGGFDDFHNNFRDFPSNEVNDVDEEEIIPKTLRQPRKQVLETDEHDATVKVIEQENFRLPTAKPSENEDCDNPGVCCFCSKRGDRGAMLRVPRGEERLARWIEKLGPEFEKRLNGFDAENLICRNHFPEEAFSSRGRLLKGMIPFVAPDKVEVTYKIQGNDFYKLKTRKSGTGKSASINLAMQQADSDHEESSYEEDEEEEAPQLLNGLFAKPSTSTVGRPSTSTVGRPSTSTVGRPSTSNVGRPRKVKQRSHTPDEEDEPEDGNWVCVPRKYSRSRSSAIRSISPDDNGQLAGGDTDYIPNRASTSTEQPEKRKRGRPRKYQVPVEQDDGDLVIVSHSQGTRSSNRRVIKRSVSIEDEDWVEDVKPPVKKGEGRHNIRIGGRFAKASNLPAPVATDAPVKTEATVKTEDPVKIEAPVKIES